MSCSRMVHGTHFREAWEKKAGDAKDRCIFEIKLVADDQS